VYKRQQPVLLTVRLMAVLATMMWSLQNSIPPVLFCTIPPTWVVHPVKL
jgi:hypothetical protein